MTDDSSSLVRERQFERVMCCGESEVVEAQKDSLANLLTAGIFELHYGELAPAVSRLEAMVQAGE